MGAEDAFGARLLASGWVASNCTSTWNGKRLRVDLIGKLSVDNVLSQDVNAQDRDSIQNVAAWVRRDVVTFWYRAALQDLDLLSGPAIARYKIAAGQAIRQSPIALTRAGFLDVWLNMTDTDALRWGDPLAVKTRKAIASELQKHGFAWVRIARCEGTPPTWEVAVRPTDLNRIYVFGITGSRATDLRMASISRHWRTSCLAENLQKTLGSVAAELPW